MNLRKLHQQSATQLLLEWDDGHAGPVSLQALRDHCPCAGCRGESVLLRSYVPPPPDKSTPGRYELKGAEAVGSYAIRFVWADGHDQGIYTWEILRSLCGCDQCLREQEMAGGS